jgi:hypothetical protein
VWKSGSYRRHVSIGSLSSAPPTKKSSSLGLRTNVIDEVCQRECRGDERREANNPNRPRCCGQRRSHQARASPAADAAEQGVPALPDARLARAGLGSARRGHADVWPVVRRHATAGRRGVIGSGVQSGSAPDDVAHRHGHRRRDDRHLHSLRETVSGATGWCCLGCQMRHHMPSKPDMPATLSSSKLGTPPGAADPSTSDHQL